MHLTEVDIMATEKGRCLIVVITTEVIDISLDALQDVIEVGSKFTINIVNKNPKNDSDNIRNLYSSMYGQNKINDKPVIEKSYTIHGVPTYEPTTDQLKGSGLVEKCGLRMMTIVYEYIQQGFISKEDSFHDFISNIKRNTILSFNGKDYFIKEVSIVGMYQDFGIVCNLGCDIYG